MDALDARILLALDDDPDASSLDLARRLGIARNTLHARLQRMRTDGTIRDFSRRIDPAALGRSLVAFISVELHQSTGRQSVAELRSIPEVVEIHAVSGPADFLLKVVARDTRDLHRVTGELLAIPDVVRTNTAISLQEDMPLRSRPLLEDVARGEMPTTGSKSPGRKSPGRKLPASKSLGQ